MTAPDSGLTAALMQLAGHTEQITKLDLRQREDVRKLHENLQDLALRISGLRDTIDAQAEILASLADVQRRVEVLAGQLAEKADEPERYEPSNTPHWWSMTDADKDKFLKRLGDWVRSIFVPGYGYLAAMLPDCWAEHTHICTQLDIASELWACLYIDPQRSRSTVAAQAEFQTRYLPALAEQMAKEGAKCRHSRPVLNGARPGGVS
jgi:hypothetical protein